jgi:hypothetical protein
MVPFQSLQTLKHMNKTAIIAALVARIPQPISAGIIKGGLEAVTFDMPETPTSELFIQIHVTCIGITASALDAGKQDDVASEITQNHCALIAELREIVSRLGLTYEEPNDPFLG